MYVKCLIYGEISKEQGLIITQHLEYDIKAANEVSLMTRTKLLPHREIKLENSKQH